MISAWARITPKNIFDTTASTYDTDRAKLIPGYDNFYRWTIARSLRPSQSC